MREKLFAKRWDSGFQGGNMSARWGLVAIFLAIVAPLAAQSVTVISPNGGEVWVKGTMHDITWKADGWSGFVQISLWKDGVHKGIIAKGVLSGRGYFSWAAGSACCKGGETGGGLRVRVSREYGVGQIRPRVPLADQSNGPFTVVTN